MNSLSDRLFCLPSYHIFIIFVCAFLQNVTANNFTFNNLEIIPNSFNILEKGLTEQNFLYGVIAAASDSSFNGICGQHLRRIRLGIRRRELWALRMIDASGQDELAYLYGNNGMTGWRTICEDINIQEPLKLKDKYILKDAFPPFSIQFVSAYYDHYNPKQINYNFPVNDYLQLGICMPVSCSSNEIFKFLSQVSEEKNLTYFQNPGTKLSIAKVKILSLENLKLFESIMAVMAIVLCSIIFALVLFGSLYDEIIRQPKINKFKYTDKNSNSTSENKISEDSNIWIRLLLCFSLSANIKSLFKVKLSEDSMPAIHGLKAFGMMYLQIVHKPVSTHNIIRITYTLHRALQPWYHSIFKKCHYSVDTYFCLGGFLVGYLFCKTFKGKKPPSFAKSVQLFLQMIFARIYKMFPLYVLIMLIATTIWRIVENTNPLFDVYFTNEQACQKYWWRNFLFISTYYFKWGEHCLVWSWYLSNDMQFYALNCIILIIGLRYFKLTEHLIKFLILIGVICTIYFAIKTNYIMTMDELGHNVFMYYFPPLRMAAYFVGSLAGIYFYKWNGTLPFSEKQIRFGWLIFFVSFPYIVFCLQYPHYSSLEYNAFIAGIGRPIWAACIAWLTMCSLTGNAGIVGKFLSYPGWIPLSRIAFSVNLTNFIVCYAMYFTADIYENISYSQGYFSQPGLVGLCIFVGLITSLLFESPLSQITKVLTTANKKQKLTEQEKIK